MVPSKRSPPPIDEDEDEEKKPRALDERCRGRKQVRLDAPAAPPEEQANAQAVTPASGTATTAEEQAEEDVPRSARRAIFATPSAAASSANAVTPPKETSPAKRKLIFGRSVVETVVKDSVRQVYGIVKKLTGSIGGNGAFGPIYGELTMGSMQKMINLMKEHTEFNSSSRFIDVGSGIGKPNLHVTQDPGCEFSYGIEIEYSRWLLGLNCLKGTLDAAQQQQQNSNVSPDARILHRCMFVQGDIRSAKTFDPFTHVYMFSIGFPPTLWCDLSDMWNRSASLYLICYHSPRDIIHNYEFEVELLAQMPTSMHGSKEGHMGYIYKRAATVRDSKNAPTTVVADPPCDPYFAKAWKSVQSGLESLQEEVNATVAENMKSGASTRSSRSRN